MSHEYLEKVEFWKTSVNFTQFLKNYIILVLIFNFVLLDYVVFTRDMNIMNWKFWNLCLCLLCESSLVKDSSLESAHHGRIFFFQSVLMNLLSTILSSFFEFSECRKELYLL